MGQATCLPTAQTNAPTMEEKMWSCTWNWGEGNLQTRTKSVATRNTIAISNGASWCQSARSRITVTNKKYSIKLQYQKPEILGTYLKNKQIICWRFWIQHVYRDAWNYAKMGVSPSINNFSAAPYTIEYASLMWISPNTDDVPHWLRKFYLL